MEPEGRRGSSRPRSASAITDVRDVIEPTERNLQSPNATEPLIRWLIAAAKRRTTITYGEVGRRLEEEHGFGKIFPPLRVGVTADAVVDEIRSVDESAPLLVSLLVNKKTKLPGKGIEKHISDERMTEAMEEVYAYRRWDDLYERLYENEDAERRRSCRASGFAPTLVPNDETVRAIEAARRGELITVGGVDGLMAHLNEDD